MLKIYDIDGFPNPQRVRIALAEKEATDRVEFIPVDVLGGEHRSEAFRSKNPDAAVPLLELEDGTFISQCTAITEYLDGTFGEPSICGNSPSQRAKVHMMNRRAEAGILDAVGAYFHHATPGLGPDLEVYQNAEWGEKQKENAQNSMRYFDEVLAESEFVACDEFSMADITLFTGLAFADLAKVEISPNLINLKRWRENVAARPSVAN